MKLDNLVNWGFHHGSSWGMEQSLRVVKILGTSLNWDCTKLRGCTKLGDLLRGLGKETLKDT